MQRRQNTGFADGLWDFSFSGHVEHGESMTAAAVREGAEELGISLDGSDLKFMALVHKRERDIDLTYINAYFYCEIFKGCPEIKEPHKCSELSWFYIDELPADIIPDRLKVLQEVQKGCAFIEYGW